MDGAKPARRKPEVIIHRQSRVQDHSHPPGAARDTTAHLTGRAALVGRIHQEPVEQVDGLRGRVRDNLLQWDGRILLKGDFVVVWKFQHLLQTQSCLTLLCLIAHFLAFC